jgi:hypothetical protein
VWQFFRIVRRDVSKSSPRVHVVYNVKSYRVSVKIQCTRMISETDENDIVQVRCVAILEDRVRVVHMMCVCEWKKKNFNERSWNTFCSSTQLQTVTKLQISCYSVHNMYIKSAVIRICVHTRARTYMLCICVNIIRDGRTHVSTILLRDRFEIAVV